MDEIQKKLKEMRKTMSVSKIARALDTTEMNIRRWSEGGNMSEAWSIIIKQRLEDGRKEP